MSSSDDITYKILVFDASGSSGSHVQILLEGNGFAVSLFENINEAMAELSSAREDPYALIIKILISTNTDDFLRNSIEIAPDSRRVLLTDTTDIDAITDAINKGFVHACLKFPLNSDDFINQVKLNCSYFDRQIKTMQLKATIARQNKQLFKIASSVKHKNDRNISQLAEKDKMIRVLESRIRSAGGAVDDDSRKQLEQILLSRGVLTDPEQLCNEFKMIKESLRKSFEAAVIEAYISIDPIDYSSLFSLKKDNTGPDKTVKELLPLLLALIKSGKGPGAAADQDRGDVVLDDHFSLEITKNSTQVFLTVKKQDTHTLEIEKVKQYLELHGIINGIKNDQSILSWLQTADPGDDPFLIAIGKDSRPSKDTKIRYHFATDYLHAGKVNKDGSINFKDRGDIPYVEEEAFLAAKIFPEQGTPGMDVYGNEIPVDEPADLTFSPGPGTRISEDGARIYATVSGQPHLDAMGNVSVCPEYNVKGDVGFETGDITFDGNVIVSGKVKEGFTIRCASLTADEIHGAEVDISGDLNVSMGIVDTELVKVKGSVQAKFIHNSKINAFGDLIIQKEIVDSTIYLSGACINSTGTIINSRISAKMGIQAGIIGNVSSKPSRLTVGVDEHVKLLVAKVDAELNTINIAFKELSEEIERLEKEDIDLHAVIAQHAHVQDRSQLELKDIEKKMEDLRASGNMAALQKVAKTVGQMKERMKEAEHEINEGFDRQDAIATELSQKKKRINELEDQNRGFQEEKKRLLEFTGRNDPNPEIIVARKIESGSRIFTENASLNINRPASRCRIREYHISAQDFGGIPAYEIKIGEL